MAWGLAPRAAAWCERPANAIVAENCKPGNPRSEWDVSKSGDPNLVGFATDISVNRGQAVHFKVSATNGAASYRIDVYRLGWYGGAGAREVASFVPDASQALLQPDCLNDQATGLIDCGNWRESAAWSVPRDAVSGIYTARLVRLDNGGASHVVFIVRDDASRSDLLFQTSDTTWQAYNTWGGNSLYSGSPAGRAFKVSYNRPFITRQTNSSWFTFHEMPMVRWLEANGYDVSYFAGVDTDRRGAQLRNHGVFLSVGHDEYWSGAQRANVEAARDAGVNLAFFSGNAIFWKTRWEPSLDGSGTPYRTMVCYKESYGDHDPADPPVWTGLWRDARHSPPGDGGRPENGVMGTIYTVDAFRNDTLRVPAEFAHHPFWRATSVASLSPGDAAEIPELLGYEWDEDLDNGARPPGLVDLSSTTLSVPKRLSDLNEDYAPGTATHSLTLYRHKSGAKVFGAGTMQWSWGLDGEHDGGSGRPGDARIQQATTNLLVDMGIRPGSPQDGLVVVDAPPPREPIQVPNPDDPGASARAFPNPWRADRHAGVPIVFDGLAAGDEVRLFTLSGRWMRTLAVENASASWDLADDRGEPAASGVYVYLISRGNARIKRGTLMLIR